APSTKSSGPEMYEIDWYRFVVSSIAAPSLTRRRGRLGGLRSKRARALFQPGGDVLVELVFRHVFHAADLLDGLQVDDVVQEHSPFQCRQGLVVESHDGFQDSMRFGQRGVRVIGIGVLLQEILPQ